MQFKVEVFVSSGKPRGEASCGEEVEQQDPDNLIEAFKDVRAAASKAGAFKLREL